MAKVQVISIHGTRDIPLLEYNRIGRQPGNEIQVLDRIVSKEHAVIFRKDNQYFIATHNPYLLCAILEKADKADVAVFVTYFRDFETRIKQLTDDQLSEMLGGDPFFMSQRFVEESGE